MPRPKYGLGQGLEALVSTRQQHSAGHPGPAGPEPLSRHADPQASIPEPRRWEYASLSIASGRKKGRLALTLSHPDMQVKPRTHRLRGIGWWTAVGVLGNEGWEMVSMTRSACYFKRPSGS